MIFPFCTFHLKALSFPFQLIQRSSTGNMCLSPKYKEIFNRVEHTSDNTIGLMNAGIVTISMISLSSAYYMSLSLSLSFLGVYFYGGICICIWICICICICICIFIWIVFLPTWDQCECAGVLFLWISLCISRQLRNPVCRLLLIAGRREDTDGTKILKCFHSWSKELLNEKTTKLRKMLNLIVWEIIRD